MKNIFLIAFILGVNLVLSAADFSDQWDVWFSNTPEKTYLKKEMLQLPAKKPQQLALTEKALNLDAFAKGCDTASVRNFITVDSPRTIYLGVGCKIFALYVNSVVFY